MLDDLILNEKEFKECINKTVDCDAITNALKDELVKLNKKTHDRRHKIFEAQKKINNGEDVDKWKAFLKKVKPKEDMYLRERRLVVSRCITEQFASVGHKIIREVLNG